MRLGDFDKIDLLDLEILHDSDLYKISKMHHQYAQNPMPVEDDFEDIDIDDLDDLLDDQSLISEVLSLHRSGYDAGLIALELELDPEYVKQMIHYLSKNVNIKSEDLAADIKNLYAKNYSVAEIAELLNLKQRQVRQYLPAEAAASKKLAKKRKKSKKTTKKVSKARYSAEIKNRVLKLCKDTEMSYAEIAKITGVKRITVNRWCQQAYKQKRRKTPLTKEQREEIRTLCRDTEMSFQSIGQKYGVSAQAVARACKDIPRKSKVATPEQRKLALRLFRTTELTNAQIASRVGVSDTTIRRWRKQAGDE